MAVAILLCAICFALLVGVALAASTVEIEMFSVALSSLPSQEGLDVALMQRRIAASLSSRQWRVALIGTPSVSNISFYFAPSSSAADESAASLSSRFFSVVIFNASNAFTAAYQLSAIYAVKTRISSAGLPTTPPYNYTDKPLASSKPAVTDFTSVKRAQRGYVIVLCVVGGMLILGGVAGWLFRKFRKYRKRLRKAAYRSGDEEGEGGRGECELADEVGTAVAIIPPSKPLDAALFDSVSQKEGVEPQHSPSPLCHAPADATEKPNAPEFDATQLEQPGDDVAVAAPDEQASANLVPDAMGIIPSGAGADAADVVLEEHRPSDTVNPFGASVVSVEDEPHTETTAPTRPPSVHAEEPDFSVAPPDSAALNANERHSVASTQSVELDSATHQAEGGDPGNSARDEFSNALFSNL